MLLDGRGGADVRGVLNGLEEGLQEAFQVRPARRVLFRPLASPVVSGRCRLGGKGCAAAAWRAPVVVAGRDKAGVPLYVSDPRWLRPFVASLCRRWSVAIILIAWRKAVRNWSTWTPPWRRPPLCIW